MANHDEQHNAPKSAHEEGTGPAAGGGGPLLEYFHNVVTESYKLPPTYELAKCGCNCWYCSDCCERRGYNLRAELIPILETFRSLLMLTLTVDPTLFESHDAAYFYIRENRCISVLMQSLDRHGHLHSRRYFYVLEFQKSGNPHYHVLVDASFIPHAELQTQWGKNRPKQLSPPEANRPGFGMTMISKSDFEGGAPHAARYATKYLVKTPEEGWPEWVLRQGEHTRVPRYGVSKGFWERESKPKQSNNDVKPRQASVSYADKIKHCGSTTNLFRVDRWLQRGDEMDFELIEHRHWYARLGTNTDVFVKLNKRYEEGSRRVSINEKTQADALGAIREAAGYPVPVIARSGRGG